MMINMKLTMWCCILLALTMGLSRLTPDLSELRWKELDSNINKEMGNLHNLLGNNQIPSDEAASLFGKILSDFLENEPEFKEIEKEFFKQKESTTQEEARLTKKDLKKKSKAKNATREDKDNHVRAVRMYSFLLKRKKVKEQEGQIRKQEKEYKKDFFKFAKKACNGTLDSEPVKPDFTKEEAFEFYRFRYADPGEIDISKLDWFVKVPAPTHSYNRSAIRPGQVKGILKSKAPNTAPGEEAAVQGPGQAAQCTSFPGNTLH